MSYCAASQQVALAGGPAVGVLAWNGQSAREVESDCERLEMEGGQQVAQVQWSPNGQLLTVATKVRQLAGSAQSSAVRGGCGGSAHARCPT